MEETVEQLKKKRVIENLELALVDLQRYQSSPIIINTIAQIHDMFAEEYNAVYAVPESPKVEDEKKRPTIDPGVKAAPEKK